MQFNHDIDVHRYSIRGYATGEITVNLPLAAIQILPGHDPATPLPRHEVITHSIVVAPTRLVRDWEPQRLDQLTAEHIAQLVESNPEVVLIGTGARLTWPPRRLLAPLMERQIGFEIMDTAAACRTYNILMFEGRDVIAALMMIQAEV